jgi:glucose/arabinose dehydrogenase
LCHHDRVHPLRTAALALALLLATIAPAPALAADGAAIVGSASGRCLDVYSGSTQLKARVVIYTCHGRANQTWRLTTTGELRVYDNPARCLDVDNGDITSPAIVQTYACNGAANQRWTINADGTIVGVQSGLCLDVTGGETANNSEVELYTCHGGDNQRWTTTLGRVDTQPPTVPGNPRASALACDSATFSWDASTDDTAVAFYDVYHDGQRMKSVPGTTLSTRLDLVPGATWGLYVNARDAAGNVSQASDTVTVEVPQCAPDDEPPTAPTRLAGVAFGTSVTLTWAPSEDNTGVRAYDIYRDAEKAGTVTGSPPATSFTDSALQPSSAYAYTIVARDAQANASPPSDPVQVTTGEACVNPVCTVTAIGTDTDLPWGLATLPDGSVLYTRRDAHTIVRLNPATGEKTTMGTVPDVSGTDGEGGLLGLELSPTYATDHWLYLMYTTATDNTIARFILTDDGLDVTSRQILLPGILRNKFHNGGRLRFGPDGKLYASTGDAQNGDNAQNKDSLNGKILRLNPDGSVPSDNPFGNHVWSYGHRNPQGLAFDSQGRLWEQEFGNSIMDETNLITRGGNYGWPACEGTSGTCSTPGYIAPKHTYPVAEGSCSGITIVNSFLYVACQRGTRLYREQIIDDTLTNIQTYFNGTYGRLRTVEPAPDGGLWLATSTTGDKDSAPDNSAETLYHITLGP